LMDVGERAGHLVDVEFDVQGGHRSLALRIVLDDPVDGLLSTFRV
jgi:hypothetical protein